MIVMLNVGVQEIIAMIFMLMYGHPVYQSNLRSILVFNIGMHLSDDILNCNFFLIQIFNQAFVVQLIGELHDPG